MMRMRGVWAFEINGYLNTGEFLDSLSTSSKRNVTKAFSTFLNQPGVPMVSMAPTVIAYGSLPGAVMVQYPPLPVKPVRPELPAARIFRPHNRDSNSKCGSIRACSWSSVK